MSCDIATTIENTIDEYGRTANLRRTVPGVYDPVAGTEGAETITNHPCKAMQVDPDKSKFADSYEIGDQVVEIAASAVSVTPDITTDILMFGAEERRINEVDTKYVGDTQISHRLHLKK